MIHSLHALRPAAAAAAAAAITAVVALSAGCAARQAPAPSPSAISTATSMTAGTPPTSTTSTTSTGAVTPRPASGTSNGQNYAVTTDSIDGATPDKKGQWHAKIAQLSGGDTRVRDAFNRASQASGHGQVDQMRADAA